VAEEELSAGVPEAFDCWPSVKSPRITIENNTEPATICLVTGRKCKMMWLISYEDAYFLGFERPRTEKSYIN
jgi:hypothetical protein